MKRDLLSLAFLILITVLLCDPSELIVSNKLKNLLKRHDHLPLPEWGGALGGAVRVTSSMIR